MGKFKKITAAAMICVLMGNTISFAEEFDAGRGKETKNHKNYGIFNKEEDSEDNDPYGFNGGEWQFDEDSGEYVYIEEGKIVLDDRFIDWLIDLIKNRENEQDSLVQDSFDSNESSITTDIFDSYIDNGNDKLPDISDSYINDENNKAASGIPDLHDKVTVENAVNLLSAYDPDGAYILQYNKKEKDKMLSYWHDGKLAGDGINTAVHELCHSYSFYEGDFGNEAIYIGDKQSIIVDYTPVFSSRETASSVPEELRTFRYDYIAGDDEKLSSQVNGPYGLLNELTAYYWGTNTSVKLFDYYKTQSPTIDEWFDCITAATSSYYAYAEFRFFILHYLLYARDNHPEVYQDILSNDNFRLAFTTIDKKFEKLVEQMFSGIEEIKEIVSRSGVSVKESNDTLWFGNSGYGIFTEDYHLLMSEMEKSEYQEMLDLLEP